ncbi:hypothetical protein DL96DRAFT_520367 [Flagelloscypha sp. PMI_526]|nr:hypothetical protein DL96DRAFT_520367 [Flagelloscypha sp. PMI_526]
MALPALTDLVLQDDFYDIHSESLLMRWAASWVSLRDVRRLTIQAQRMDFPEISLNNRVEVLALNSIPNVDSFFHSLPRFSKLTHLHVSSEEPYDMKQFLDKPPQTMMPCTVTLQYNTTTYDARWIFYYIIKEISSRLQDRHNFLLRFILLHGKWQNHFAGINGSKEPWNTVSMEFVDIETGQIFSCQKDSRLTTESGLRMLHSTTHRYCFIRPFHKLM